ncbi:conserved hypothetical protein [Acinetobacter proteolyticus]|jgi:hypothetical protein|uniref:Uncharacterized protein n=1 Tax=Acinetobacter proteolyticus TaxID=1776741 RepID=A0A653K930_9GAMM|nr:conserved hypothetical protein [Acinetobacter proteolyticus]
MRFIRKMIKDNQKNKIYGKKNAQQKVEIILKIKGEI